MRLINATSLRKRPIFRKAQREAIDEEPTISAVVVTPCIECAHYQESEDRFGETVLACEINHDALGCRLETKPYDFCSRAEPKGESDE